MNITLLFTKNYGQYTAGTIAHFPPGVAENIMKLGAAKLYNPEIPEDRKTTKSKMIKK